MNVSNIEIRIFSYNTEFIICILAVLDTIFTQISSFWCQSISWGFLNENLQRQFWFLIVKVQQALSNIIIFINCNVILTDPYVCIFAQLWYPFWKSHCCFPSLLRNTSFNICTNWRTPTGIRWMWPPHGLIYRTPSSFMVTGCMC